MRLETIAKGEDLFDSLQKEEAPTDRKFDFKKDFILEELLRYHNEWLGSKMPNVFDDTLLDIYATQESIFQKYKLSAEQVTRFSILMREHEKNENYRFSGIFLSGMINISGDKEFIVLNESEEPFDYFGMFNTKKIMIEGNTGDKAAYKMKGGKLLIQGYSEGDCGIEMTGGYIEVSGNVGGGLGEGIRGGKICVKGNAGYDVGFRMENGVIKVRGDAGKFLGRNMTGGKIIIEGKIGQIDYNHGEIWENGKLIYKDGVKLK